MPFCTIIGDLYGVDMLVFNVHGLVHLAKDVERFGCLDNFSAFVFESFLFQTSFAFAQVIRRLSESKDYLFSPTYHIPLNEAGNLKKKHNNRPIPRNLKAGITCQFKEIHLPHYCLSLKRGHNCFLINDEVVIGKNILSLSENPATVVVYKKFRNVSDFFNYPLLSSDL